MSQAESNATAMQAYFAGALHGLVRKEFEALAKHMKVVDIRCGDAAPTGFEALFASGLRLAVKVEVLELPKIGATS